ncbi:DUF429 domain-containing protein [Dehalococcoidia bacterium]|nr:DUF429 domain-containing protein [Dehalococcoidia bacterium]
MSVSVNPQFRLPSRRILVHGVDFSGAADAGSKVWLATGAIVEGVLKLEHLCRVKDLHGSSTSRDQCLSALRHLITSRPGCAFGLDFPFGLPRLLLGKENWETFVLAFGSRYPDPDQFREACLTAADGRELRRLTDQESRTPFSAYNIRLYRQTYFGIRDVLAPLVRGQAACILPMQSASPRGPWVLEVCPASTLKQAGLYSPYKRRGEEHAAVRARIFDGIREKTSLLVKAPELRSKILDDPRGDALDAVIAMLATARALRNLADPPVPLTEIHALEGYVYV